MASRKTRKNAELRESVMDRFPDMLDEDRILAECDDSEWRAEFVQTSRY